VLVEAWRRAALADGRLSVVGADAVVAPEQVRNSYAEAHVLVIPSLATRRFLEPWGLVANEAMNQHLPVIATDAVGAAAGGLVRHERNGLVVRAGDHDALAAALRTLHDDPELRARLGANAAHDVAPYTHAAWADGFAAALRGATGQETPC
jgi:glycosyltransferase involved in cell wall biosynthesis